MKSTPTPHTHVGYTSRNYQTTIGGGSIKYDVDVPKGTRCIKLEGGGGSARWVVDDLSWMDKGSIAYHDADHYGITIEEPSIKDITIAK